MTDQTQTDGGVEEARRRGTRVEEVGWALFLILTGGLWLAPDTWTPEGTWLAGLGLILLGVNAARHLQRLRTDGVGIVVGLVALVAGLARILGGRLPFVPLLLVVLGAAMIVKVAIRARQDARAIDASRGA